MMHFEVCEMYKRVAKIPTHDKTQRNQSTNRPDPAGFVASHRRLLLIIFGIAQKMICDHSMRTGCLRRFAEGSTLKLEPFRMPLLGCMNWARIREKAGYITALPTVKASVACTAVYKSAALSSTSGQP
jgi:hypothetical protein